MNSDIKTKNPNAFIIAEVYNPKEYRYYINLGKMDYLYDKVEMYDKLKEVIQGKSLPDPISEIQSSNKHKTQSYDPVIKSFVRWSNNEKLIIVNNFSSVSKSSFDLKIPKDVILKWKLKDGNYKLKEQIFKKKWLN